MTHIYQNDYLTPENPDGFDVSRPRVVMTEKGWEFVQAEKRRRESLERRAALPKSNAFYPYARAPRPGTVRYALAGAALGILAFVMVRPLCLFMVTAGTWLEAVMK